MADWLPGWSRYLFNLRGKPYQFTHNPKGCLHTTEGSSIAGALSAYAPYPPHGIYDWRSREKLQHIPLSLASYSAMDGNDDDYMVQIELVGFAAESRFWPDEAWRNIAEDVLKPLEDNFGVPRRALGFRDARDGISPPLATAESPIRLGWTGLRDYAGWLGHQHLPAPDEHWDPGAIQINKAFAFMEEEHHMSEVLVKGNAKPEIYRLVFTPKGIFKALVPTMDDANMYIGAGSAVQTRDQAWVDNLWTYQQDDAPKILQKLDAISTPTIDYTQLAAALGPQFADQVATLTADKLAARLKD
jgi:hypothetical protein